MVTSEAITRGIRVHAVAHYSPEHSQPLHDRGFFVYTVQISNEGSETVQLISRHWITTDASNNVQEVQGLGVVGRQPILAPGECHSNTRRAPRYRRRSGRCAAPTR